MKKFEISYKNGRKVVLKGEVAAIENGYLNILEPDTRRNGTIWTCIKADNIVSVKEVK